MLRNDSATNTWRMKLQQDVRFGTPCSMFNVSVPYIVLAASVQGRKFETLLSPAPPHGLAWRCFLLFFNFDQGYPGWKLA
jgi:hypothetical protein